MQRSSTDFNHLKKWNSAAMPGFTAGLAVPIYSQTKNTAKMQAIAYPQCTKNIIKIFNAAPNSDSQRLQKLEYQFFVLECILGFGAMGDVSSSGLLGDPELDSACKQITL